MRLVGTCLTQWRTSMNGVEGLDYPALVMCAPLCDPPVELDADVWTFVRIFEAERLLIQQELHEDAEKKRQADEAAARARGGR